MVIRLLKRLVCFQRGHNFQRAAVLDPVSGLTELVYDCHRCGQRWQVPA